MSQFDEALGQLLQHHIYGERGEAAPAGAVCNELQTAYLRATRQHPADPARPLSPFDFRYMLQLHCKTPTPATVTRKEFAALWEWFGPIVSRIRHDKAIGQLWTQGLVMGFISKAESEELLRGEKPGTFVLRFSSQAPGSFAVAYAAPTGGGVAHYLLKKTDINVSVSLAKFLLEKPFFATLLQTVPSFSERRQWQRADKKKALGKWDKEASGSAVAGYDEVLNIPFANMQLE